MRSEGPGHDQLEAYRRMTPAQKLRAVFRLRRAAIRLKVAAARKTQN